MQEIIIGDQIWSSENLNVVTFMNGDEILECKTEKEWKKAGKNFIPAYCSYNFKNDHDPIHGKLYNWFALNDPRSLTPVGWTIPSEDDWSVLITFLGEKQGIKLKSKTGWIKGEDGFLDLGTDNFGFNALPSGVCEVDGKFESFGTIGIWWSKTALLKSNGQEFGSHGMAYYRSIASANGNTESLIGSMSKSFCDKRKGLSVRMIKAKK